METAIEFPFKWFFEPRKLPAQGRRVKRAISQRMLWPAFRLALLLSLLPWACAGACSGCGKTGPKAAEQHEFTLFITTDLMGNLEPCGCTTDPLGDLARTAELIERARRGKQPVIYLDGGSLLYPERRISDSMVPQEQLKADLLAKIFADQLAPAGVGLGPYDLARGPEKVHPPRQAANVDEKSGVLLDPPKVVDAGGLKVGIFGVVSPAVLSSTSIRASDPAAAARKAVESLRRRGAKVVIAIAHMTRPEVSELSRAVPGIDFAVVGQTVPNQTVTIRHEPVLVKDTWLIEPTDHGQVVARVDVTVRGEGGFSDAIGKAQAEASVAALDKKIEALKADLAKWEKDPSGDKAWVADKRRELAENERERKELGERPLRVPESGNWFVLSQIEIKKGLACNKAVQDAKLSFDVAVGKANQEAAKKVQPLPAAPGKPSYIGVGECENCHSEQVEFWKKTRHHQAWDTLEKRHKEFNLDCISCHVTGWDQAGGSSLARNADLRDVQCEVCHGPGSLHAEASGAEKPNSLTRRPEQKLCVTCHSPEHSDTFDYKAYLRDVTGPGHGEKMRTELGPGQTGHELRRAGLEKAGKALGEGCAK
jgi:hypothetical protein